MLATVTPSHRDKWKYEEIFVDGFSGMNGIYFSQEKQAENKQLQQRVESLEKMMKDMKTKFEYVWHLQ